MFRVLFAPILRSTSAPYSHRCVYLWKAEVIIVSGGVELHFAWINGSLIKVTVTLRHIYVLVCVSGSAFVLCGHDVWFFGRRSMCAIIRQEITRALLNPKVRHRIHKYPPPVSILNQPNPVHTLTFHLSHFHCLCQRFSNCGPRTTSGPRVLPFWSS
jgi:hypothetical protein